MAWGFLTNHAQALLCIAEEPGSRLRDIADRLGITERSAHGIVADLVQGGYVHKTKQGRRNRYAVDTDKPLPEARLRQRTVGELLELLNEPDQRPDSHAPGRTAATASTGSRSPMTAPREP